MTCTSATVIGNITADPELRHLPSGTPAVTFTIATSERHFNPDTRRFSDGPTVYLRCQLIGPGADNAADGLPRGTRVIAHGALAQRAYTDRHGRNHLITELRVHEIGPTVRYTQVRLTPAFRPENDPDRATAAHDPTPQASATSHDNSYAPIGSASNATAVVDLDADPGSDSHTENHAHQ